MEQAAKLERREFFMAGPSRLSSFTRGRGRRSGTPPVGNAAGRGRRRSAAAVETSHAGNFQPASATYLPLNHASVNQLARFSTFSRPSPMFKLSHSPFVESLLREDACAKEFPTPPSGLARVPVPSAVNDERWIGRDRISNRTCSEDRVPAKNEDEGRTARQVRKSVEDRLTRRNHGGGNAAAVAGGVRVRMR